MTRGVGGARRGIDPSEKVPVGVRTPLALQLEESATVIYPGIELVWRRGTGCAFSFGSA